MGLGLPNLALDRLEKKQVRRTEVFDRGSAMKKAYDAIHNV